jgi:hypothetical protein
MYTPINNHQSTMNRVCILRSTIANQQSSIVNEMGGEDISSFQGKRPAARSKLS